jgi:hypothetical protein
MSIGHLDACVSWHAGTRWMLVNCSQFLLSLVGCLQSSSHRQLVRRLGRPLQPLGPRIVGTPRQSGAIYMSTLRSVAG